MSMQPAGAQEMQVWRPDTRPEAASAADQVAALRARSTPGSTDWLMSLAAASDLQREAGDPTGAVALADTVIHQAGVESTAPAALVRALVSRAGAARDRGEPVPAHEWGMKALATAERYNLPAWLLAEIHLNLAVSAQMLQKMDEVESHLAAAASLLRGREEQEPYLMAQLLGGQAVTLVLRGKPLDALALMEQSVGWFERAQPTATTAHSIALQNLAVLAMRLERLPLMATTLDRIASFCRAEQRPNHCDEGRLALSYGQLAMRREQFPEAERHYMEALRLWGTQADANAEWLDLLIAIGEVRVESGRARAAVDILRQAVERAAAALPPSHPQLLGARGHYATALSDSGDQAGAMAQYREMIQAQQAALGEAATGVSRANLGSILLALRDPTATAELRQAYTLVSAGAGPRARTTLVARANLIRSLVRDGETTEALGLAEGLLEDAAAGLGQRHTQYPFIAAAVMAAWNAGGRRDEAVALAERMLPVATEAITLGRSESVSNRRELAELAANTLWAQDKVTMSATHERVFPFLQAALGSTTDLYWSQAAIRMSMPETAVLARTREEARQQLRLADRAQQRALAARQPVATDIERLSREADDAAIRFQQADAALRKADPRLGLLSELPPVTLSQVRQHLRPGEGMLLLVPATEATHVFLVTRDKVHWHRADLPEQALCTRIAHVRLALDPARPLSCRTTAVETASPAVDGRIMRGSPAGHASRFDRVAAHALYRDLLAPLEPDLREIRQLQVVTGGFLAQLPLATLVTDLPPGDDDRSWRATGWLIQRHALSNVPSPAAFVLARGRPLPIISGGILAFGAPCFAGISTDGVCLPPDPNGTGLSALPTLPGSRQEVKALEELSPKGRLYLGAAATEAAWNRGPGSAGTVAVATHGLMAGEAGAVEPTLALTPGDGGDGYLTASEIARGPDLSGRMLVLSGCNTATPGGDSRDNAATALVRALFAAGARVVLASQIPVRDDMAPRLTVPVLAGGGTPEALRGAILAVLEDPALPPDDPRLWAGFALYRSE
ncbi:MULTISPECIES: CHAT domain-containing tetratricopeptide repeat protein [unclassified Azospirillum]|uniref:CHAT domain-containing tetratricopeptide repeat protein n=1 Tax=unclassified Azospirillum TaxID=2630922 RepID=UPI001358FF07|nr:MULTISPECIES: CHAT domain-containing tetratricopeptide repeat protein [unclassified Azospirillum]